MKRWLVLILIILTLFLSPVLGALPADPTAAASQVEVESLTIDPAVLMPHDTAVVTVVLKNTGSEAVPISHAILYDKDLMIISDNYGKVGSIGAGNSMTMEFTIQARAKTGIFYPILSLDFRGAHFLRAPFKVLVQEEPLEMAVLSKPENFTEGKKDIVWLHIGNPRDNEVSAVTITPSGREHEIIPTSYFVGALSPDGAFDIPFNITPYGNSSVVFNVTYQNGINPHMISYVLPINLGESRKQADPVLSNVMVVDEGDLFRVTGDVTNSGLETANAVEVTSGGDATPVFPYKLYAVGALKPDDFSSFEVTFRADGNVTEIPLLASFKDKDGNEFISETLVELDHQDTGPDKGESTESPGDVVYIVLGIVAIVVVIAIWYSRRRKQ